MKTKIIALIMVLILINSNIAFAVFFDPITKEQSQDIWGRELVGDAIFIEAAGYEHNVIPASVLNDQEVPVYVYLKGTTLGGSILGSNSLEAAPFYGLPNIKDIQIRTKGIGSKYIGGVSYIKPKRNELTSDNKFYDLGYLIVNIRKIEKENEIPDKIDVDMTARVEFELENSFGDFGSQDLALKENLDEEKWKDEPDGNFWGRTGYVRVSKIKDDKVTLQVYDGFLRSLSFGSITLDLKNKQESQVIRIPRANNLANDQFRIRLNDIIDEKDKAYVRIVKDGKIEYKWVFEGQPIYYGSKWIVKDIRKFIDSNNAVNEEVVLEDKDGNSKSLIRKYTSETIPVSPINPSEEVIITPTQLDSWIESYSKEYNIDPNLVKGLILAESSRKMQWNGEAQKILNKYSPGWETKLSLSNLLEQETIIKEHPGPKSAYTAYGYGQIIETTAQFISESEKMWGVKDSSKRFDPESNVRMTVYYLSYLLDKNNGDKRNALVGYTGYSGGEAHINKILSFAEAYRKATEKYVFDETKKTEEEKKEEIKAEDVCSKEDLVEIKDITETTEPNKVLCRAIYELNSYLNKYGEDQNKNEINYYLGLSYEQLGDLSGAKEKLQKIDSDSDYYDFALEKLKVIDDKINNNLEEISLSLDDENSELLLKEIHLVSGSGAKVKIRTTGTDIGKEYSIGDYLEYNDGTSNIKSIWYIKSINSDSIILSAKFENENQEREQKLLLGGSGATFNLGNNKNFNAILEDIQTNKQAYLTVLPGSGRALAETEFTIHIPIEQYGIKFSDEQIDSQINWTEKQIKSLTKIIDKLDDIIQWGNKICWSLWGAFTLRNLFTPDVRKARNLVMNGLDGESGVKEICKEKIKNGEYKTYDQCVYDKRETISELIKVTKKSVDDSKKASNFGDFKLQDFKYSDQNGKEQQMIGKSDLISYGMLKDLDKSLGDSEDSFYNSFKGSISKQVENSEKDLNKIKSAVNEANQIVERKGLNNNEKSYYLFNKIYNEQLEEEKVETPSGKELYRILNLEISDTFTENSNDGKEKNYYFDNNNDIKQISPLTVGEYEQKLKNKEEELTDQDDINIIKKARESLSKLKGTNQAITEEGGFYIYEEENNKNIIISRSNVEGRRTTYAEDATIELFLNGKPKFYPIGNGDYIEVKEYYSTGSVKEIALWNVGPDGKLGTGDDKQILSESQLKQKENLDKEGKLKQSIDRSKSCKVGDYVIISGAGRFLCSDSKAQAQKVSQYQCTDVFSITECQLLFNFCDPVMCPASRFNLGGKYEVSNVVQTGLIGSLVLGMPNWFIRIPGIGGGGTGQYIPPICLTGVSSSTKAYRSMLEGYQQCLQVSKDEGKNVGICEKIRSVFWCELAWREASAIGKALINIKNTKDVYDYLGSSGGGEYTLLQQQATYISDSSKFFTQEYAKNAFAAYKARSTAEFGSELCKAFIGVKGPDFGKFFNELTKPESPAQFTAFFDEKPWSTEAGMTTLTREAGLTGTEEQSLYNVYYHIYAGEDQDVRYTVFLRDDYGNVAYVTDRAGGYNGFIAAGSFSDKNIDFIGRSGYKEICVVINGNYECGFGKASTSFALNRVSDALVSSSYEKEINSAEECTPEFNGPSTSVAGIPVVLPTNVPGVTNNGIVRICAVKNPGEGVNLGDYKDVGTCGKDELGRNLGDCYVDLRTVSRAIKSTDFRANVSARYGENLIINDELAGKIFDNNEELLGVYLALTQEDVDYIYDNIKDLSVINELTEVQHSLQKLKDGDGNVGSYRDLSKFNFGTYGKLAQIRIGQVYYGIGKYLKSKEVQENKKEETKTSNEEQISGTSSVDSKNLNYKLELVIDHGMGINFGFSFINDIVNPNIWYKWDGSSWLIGKKEVTKLNDDYHLGLEIVKKDSISNSIKKLNLYCDDNDNPDFILNEISQDTRQDINNWINQKAEECLSRGKIEKYLALNIIEKLSRTKYGNSIYIPLFKLNDIYLIVKYIGISSDISSFSFYRTDSINGDSLKLSYHIYPIQAKKNKPIDLNYDGIYDLLIDCDQNNLIFKIYNSNLEYILNESQSSQTTVENQVNNEETKPVEEKNQQSSIINNYVNLLNKLKSLEQKNPSISCEFEYNKGDVFKRNLILGYNLRDKKWYWKLSSLPFPLHMFSGDAYNLYHLIHPYYLLDEVDVGVFNNNIDKQIFYYFSNNNLSYKDGVNQLLKFARSNVQSVILYKNDIQKSFDYNAYDYSNNLQFIGQLCGFSQ